MGEAEISVVGGDVERSRKQCCWWWWWEKQKAALGAVPRSHSITLARPKTALLIHCQSEQAAATRAVNPSSGGSGAGKARITCQQAARSSESAPATNSAK